MTRIALEGPSVGTKAEGRSALKSSPGMSEGEAGGNDLSPPSLVDQEGVRPSADDLRWAVYTAAYAVLRDYDNHPSKDRGLIAAGDRRIPNLIADSVVERFQALAVMSPRIGQRDE